MLRVLLHGLSFIYERAVLLRLFLYRHRIFRERTLGCLVISIGNLTVGGTGKTPVVEKFARALALRRTARRNPEPRLQERAAADERRGGSRASARRRRARRASSPTANRSCSIRAPRATSPTCSRTTSKT